ncbi:MAG: homoserine dehydrogenase [Pseudomonadota bacterium]|nr:homoserine dehydrogenase [Pseudomonadota bacterium]
MVQPLKIALAGLGTVGGGTYRLLRNHAELLATRAGRPLRVTCVTARDRFRDRGFTLEGVRWYEDVLNLTMDPDVDVVVELIGGEEGPALALIEKSLERRKHVVTANKALIARHGMNLAKLAEKRGVTLGYEGAVGGGIPIIKGLREGLASNEIHSLYGILNGTCNYILTEMRRSNRPFDEVLAETQMLGYAEKDATNDVDGFDSAHKIAILAAIAFGTGIDADNIHIEGIRSIAPMDIRFARELGYRIKLLAIARRRKSGIDQRVHPALVSATSPVAAVDGVFNAIMIEGDPVDRVTMTGRGAGAGPTASAVVADIVDIARGNRNPVFGIQTTHIKPLPRVPILERFGAYYLRLSIPDRPGLIAEITKALGDRDISIETVLHKNLAPGQATPIVLTTHATRESDMIQAVEAIRALGGMTAPPCLIRIEDV